MTRFQQLRIRLSKFVLARPSILTLLALSILCAGVLRFYKLGALPLGLNRDEASLGYSAYAIQLRGVEEHGTAFPLNFKSFGDWKLGGYVYVLIPFVIGLGLEDWVVRLPSALAGIALVPTVYVLTTILIAGKKGQQIGLLTALFITFSPWSLHLSRVAYEGNLALFLLTMGIVCFLKGTKKSWLYPASALLFVASMFTYHAFQLFAPLMAVVLIGWQRNEIIRLWKQRQHIFIAAALSGLLGVGLLVLSGSGEANTVKFGGLSVFSPSNYAELLFEKRSRFPESLSFFAHLYSNSYLEVGSQLLKNIWVLTSGEFLYVTGGNHPTHHLPGSGLLHWHEGLMLVLSLLLISKKKEPWQIFLLAWLLLASIPALITLEPNHPIRFVAAMVPLALISSYGIWFILDWMANKRRNVLSFAIVFIVVSYSYFTTVATYFFQFPVTGIDIWPWYMTEVVSKTWLLRTQYKMVVIQGESSSPYIYYLYLNRLDPAQLKERLEFYPPDGEGFEHVKRLDNIYFQTVIWDDLQGKVDRILFVLTPENIPREKIKDEDFKVIGSISRPDAKTELVLLEYVKDR